MEKIAEDHPDRPMYHVMAPHGWINDPNGPLFHQGLYHLFYQHVPESTEWQFGIVWGHAVSTDLAHWRHLPSAIKPGNGELDGDGCFSGCCVVDEQGIPTILYTGVRLRNNPRVGVLPHEDADLGLPFIETQCCAVTQGHDDDPYLKEWKKCGTGVEIPPPELGPASKLVGWRDPFIFKNAKNGSDETEYEMLIGSGFKEEGGTALIYKSNSILSGWKYDRLLCKASSTRTGAMWECPLLVDLSSAGAKDHRDHFFCISPDAPTKKVLYWLGAYTDGTFMLEDAIGPFVLDLGDVLYAPNILVDSDGRSLMWGWLQEREGKNVDANYSGCMTIPRVLSLRDGHLHQAPAPEVKLLRGRGGNFEGFPKDLSPDTPLELIGLKGRGLDVEVTVQKESASLVGVFIKSWEEDNPNGTAAILYDWDHNMLEIVYDFDPSKPCGDDPRLHYSASKCVGGKLPFQGSDEVGLRVLIDGSCVEAYTNSGAALSARVYRGLNPRTQGTMGYVCENGVCTVREIEPGEEIDPGSGVWLLSIGGTCQVTKLAAWEMGTAWVHEDSDDWLVACKHDKVVPVAADVPYGTHVGRCVVCGGLHHKSCCPDR